MKWILVVLIGGVTPIQTDVVFEKLSDCLVAEQQLRQTYADALDTWSQQAAMNSDQDGRRSRRDYYRLREFEAKRFANTGTCVPHAGTDKPIASLEPASPSPPQPPAASSQTGRP